MLLLHSFPPMVLWFDMILDLFHALCFSSLALECQQAQNQGLVFAVFQKKCSAFLGTARTVHESCPFYSIMIIVFSSSILRRAGRNDEEWGLGN